MTRRVMIVGGVAGGAVQLVQVEPNGLLRGATDPRSGGLSLGF